MPSRPARSQRSNCPLNISLELFGDRWTLLIVRDLMFKGATTFGELMDGGEGIASNVLANRLNRLEEHKIVSRQPDPTDARRFIYRLTCKGIDLAPVLVDMIVWAARYEETAAPLDRVAFMEDRRAECLVEIRDLWRNAKQS